MKKICLLAIGSFFSTLAFCQSAATVQTVPGQPKVHATAVRTGENPAFTNAAGAQTATKVTPKQAAKSKKTTIKPAAAAVAVGCVRI